MATIRSLAAEYAAQPHEIAASLDLGAYYSETAEVPADVEAQYREVLDLMQAQDEREPADLADATETYRAADDALAEARTDLYAAVRHALATGTSVAQVAAITGLSRERVYQIRDGRR